MSIPSLLNPYKDFAYEAEWLLDSFGGSIIGLSTPGHRTSRLAGEMAVVRLYDSWARFCREVVIPPAGGRPYTKSGVRLPLASGVKHPEEAIAVFKSSYTPPRRNEPRWAIAGECLHAARCLGISNYSTFSAAIGAANSPAEELRYVRNFFPHRGREAINSIRRQSLYNPGMYFALEDLAGQLVPPGITRMESWIVQLRTVAQASIL